MSRPRQLLICGQPLALESADLGEDEAGRAHVSEQRLLIARGLAPLQERDTVLHEAIHALGQMTGHDMEEGLVAALGTGLLAVLRENLGLVMWLTEEVE